MKDRDIFVDLFGPKKFNTWSKENPAWWILYRTSKPGHWTKEDVDRFNSCTGKFIIYFDHRKQETARLVALKILDSCGAFMAIKVSKFARDGEKVMAILAKDDKMKAKVQAVCEEFDLYLYGFRDPSTTTEVERMMQAKYDEYLMCLGKAYAPMRDKRRPLVKEVNFF